MFILFTLLSVLAEKTARTSDIRYPSAQPRRFSIRLMPRLTILLAYPVLGYDEWMIVIMISNRPHLFSQSLYRE